MVIKRTTITSNIAKVEERPFLSSHAREGRQITAIKIDRKRGFKIGAAAFMPAIIMQIAASESSTEFRLIGISFICNELE